ncbi:hypothetical protein [Phaffia rhodozyma]|uniref:Uncharacterized protein n=1 Tax=Phaffia rhodozyma TaxID=264483 RepID=A0A0F7ST25_PHARH|nr:hypothetical protein [Phaffia rhodozyma]
MFTGARSLQIVQLHNLRSHRHRDRDGSCEFKRIQWDGSSIVRELTALTERKIKIR